jgi:predicted Rossmann fold flavoprotein
MNPQLKVTIVEKSNKVLSKVKVSGGGRCNVTHDCTDIQELVKRYPRGQNFLKKSFHWFNTIHTIDWFKERGVLLKVEADGRMFPSTNSSQTIIDCLLKELNQYKVELKLGFDVNSIEQANNQFKLKTADLRQLSADYLCIASGGYPKATQFEWLKKIGHSIENPVPSLFTFNIPNNTITQLMGVSVELAQIKIISSKLNYAVSVNYTLGLKWTSGIKVICLWCKRFG